MRKSLAIKCHEFWIQLSFIANIWKVRSSVIKWNQCQSSGTNVNQVESSAWGQHSTFFQWIHAASLELHVGEPPFCLTKKTHDSTTGWNPQVMEVWWKDEGVATNLPSKSTINVGKYTTSSISTLSQTPHVFYMHLSLNYPKVVKYTIYHEPPKPMKNQGFGLKNKLFTIKAYIELSEAPRPGRRYRDRGWDRWAGEKGEGFAVLCQP